MTSWITPALFILAAAEIATLWRLFKGPTMPDRLTAAAAAVNILTFILAVAGALKGSELYYEAALAAALLSFSSVIILAKFIGTRRVL
jgi:multisubunit Na+/H+ antiporter MnhF subunit